MRSRLKLSYFLGLMFFFVVMILAPLIANARPLVANQDIKVGYSEAAFTALLSKEVKPLAQAYGIKPSVLMGQVILETNYGKTLLASRYHNLLTLPARPGQASVVLRRHKDSTRQEAFAVYRNRDAALRDYLLSLRLGKGDNKKLYQHLAREKNYKKAANALQTYRYPEDTTYANRLIQVIESEGLTRYDSKN
ncbi:glycoside hydrolase family 73 protein [Streptococcus phocae subsp. phocae]|uniref:N-acetylmuramidase n=1 Tax=Streptococcus phocae TaxID=119224 RepID=A0A0P6S8L7_9STRE|nr:glucosaminidase domain-containing protein [Streptococcus phocae]KPJ22838.1 N-acetylmuramidase [Streptococcus phocae]